MGLKEQLQADLKAAMLAKDERRKTVVRVILAEIKNAEIAKIGALTDAEQLGVIQSEIKKRRDALDEMQRAHRPELLQEAQAQLDILLTYVPQQMSREEIAAAAQAVIAELGAAGPQAMGAVMGKLMPQLKGKADGKLINEVVRDLLK
jgi:uncharacterized protein YqeY